MDVSSSQTTEYFDMEEPLMEDVNSNISDTNEDSENNNTTNNKADEPDPPPMQLKPPLLALWLQPFKTMEDLIDAVNEHAAKQGYAIVKSGYKKNKSGDIRKKNLKCTRGGKYKDKVAPDDRKQTRAVRTTGCKWGAYGKLVMGEWYLFLKDTAHNHPPSKPEALDPHRKLKAEDLKTVVNDRKRHLTAQQTVTGLCIDNPSRFYKKQDIYNAIRYIWRTELGNLTPFQALLKELTTSEKWYIFYAVDPWDQLNRLFFVYQLSPD